jgi:integrase
LRFAASLKVPVMLPSVKPLPEPQTTGRVRVWTDDEVARLFVAIQERCPQLLGPVVTLLNTGMRRGEVLVLEWSWVDLERGLIFIQPNEFWRPKSGKPREVPINAALRPWLAAPPKQREHARYVFTRKRRASTPDGFVRIPYRTWPQRQFDEAVAAAKVGGSPHIARHTYASHFLKATSDLFLLAQVLGHSHTRVTEIYSHLLPDHLERARDAVSFPAPLASVPRHGPDMVSSRRRRK